MLVIDAYRTWNCGTWIGDVTASWSAGVPRGDFVAAEPVDGVPVVVRSTLTDLLDRAGASVQPAGFLRRDGVRVELDRPELWIDWLDHPPRLASQRNGSEPAL